MHRIVLLFALTGCSDKSAKTQAPAPSAQADQPAPTGMSCMGLMQCMVACTDGECTQGCLAQTDAATQAAATAFLQCNASKCEKAGADCLATECQAEMTACTGANEVAAAAKHEPPQEVPAAQVDEQLVYPDQPHTTANLLPWMTGQWVGTNHQFEFWADGRVKRASGVPLYSRSTGNYQCVSTINEIGTVRQEGDLLIMEFAPAASNHCGDKDVMPEGITVRYKITWYKYSDLPTNLLLVDIDCTRGAMYCNDQMRRR